jgi:hypothetical protein
VRQELLGDSVQRYIEAAPETVYDIVSDVTRTPEYSPDIVKASWIGGATGPAVGARFKAINRGGNRPNWWNKPVIVIADRGREFAFARTETFGGTLEWRYTLSAEGVGTRVVEAYTVTKEVTSAAKAAGNKDQGRTTAFPSVCIMCVWPGSTCTSPTNSPSEHVKPS